MNTPLIDQMEAVSTLLAEEGPVRSEKAVRQRLDERGYEPFNPHRAIMWLRALGIVSKHGIHAYTFHAKLRFPDEHYTTATYETAINSRQDLADTLRAIADWVEESIGEPDEEEWA